MACRPEQEPARTARIQPAVKESHSSLWAVTRKPTPAKKVLLKYFNAVPQDGCLDTKSVALGQGRKQSALRNARFKATAELAKGGFDLAVSRTDANRMCRNQPGSEIKTH